MTSWYEIVCCVTGFAGGLYLIWISVQYLRGKRPSSIGPTLQHFGVPVGVLLALTALLWAVR